jgi:D-alanyl-lipoteichoic acid acyltransferase DltB (MBOAT superfamily)
MLFNSFNFVIFLPIVFSLYWFVFGRNLKWQNFLLLTASYFFYASCDWRFLFLLIFSTGLDYFTGLKIAAADNKKSKKAWLYLSVIINLGILAVFKYYNFFAGTFATSLQTLGFHVNFWVLEIILPLGISFYTFHGLSYIFDIYRDKIKPSHNFVEYAVFVSFFPLLVAGPIERATHLLPQIQRPRHFDYEQAVDGLRQMLWGFFKKIAIADLLANYVELIFNNYTDYSGSTLALGAILFSFQIYCDFSGYSDIALGVAKLFGINLLKNFSFPYFSRDIAEFWRRWHISLTSWFRDYVYIPLGGSRGGTWSAIRNTFIIFLLCGFWHGANFTYIAWGLLNALYFLPLLLTHRNRKNLDVVAQGKRWPTILELASMVSTFMLVTFSLLVFRSPSLHAALGYVDRLFSKDLLSRPEVFPIYCLWLVAAFIFIEWCGREQEHALAKFGLKWPRVIRWSFYVLLSLMTLSSISTSQSFIYFRF